MGANADAERYECLCFATSALYTRPTCSPTGPPVRPVRPRRLRAVIFPAPSLTHLLCAYVAGAPTPKPTEAPTRQPTREPTVPAVSCVVSGWSSWASCTATCDGGFEVRTRTVATPQAGAGAACPNTEDFRVCNTMVCPVDCSV
jgi:hypothetical protein